MSADTVSQLYPDRPIRPLPRRRLREKLSPDAAERIQYPPAPQTTTPLFYYPYNGKDDDVDGSAAALDEKVADLAAHYASLQNGGLTTEGHFSAMRRMLMGESPTPLSSQAGRLQGRDVRVPEAVTAEDGDDFAFDSYDTFENANNKKKRKIPTAGETLLGGLHSSLEGAGGLASVGASGDVHGDGSGPTSTPYYVPTNYGPSGAGMSGPGRGRLGRMRNGRSPLRALPDASGNWAGRNAKLQSSQWLPQTGEAGGIISAAIADAEKFPSPGQENISLLQQHQAMKSMPVSSQFTFTCDSQVPVSFSWPNQLPDARPPLHDNRADAPTTSGAYRYALPNQTGARPAVNQPAAPQFGPPRPPQDQARERGSQQSDGTQKKPRRRVRDYEAAANRRRLRAQQYNARHQLKDEDIWICEFCEYEMIFGYPPHALIRQYEIKDHKVRQQEAERRRLLEKAKMRGRKGRKQPGKMPAKANDAVDAPLQQRQSSSGQPPPSMHSGHSPDTASDEYYDYVEEDPVLNPKSLSQVESQRAKLEAEKAQLAREKAKLERVKIRLEKEVEAQTRRAGSLGQGITTTPGAADAKGTGAKG